MTGRGYGSVTRGRRPDHVVIRARSTLAQLEAATRASYRGIPVVPAGAPIWDWRVCGCDYAAPIVNGKRVRQADDPMFAWGEEESRTGRLKSLAEEVRRLVLLYGLGYFHAKDAFRMFPGHPDCTIWGAGLWTAGVQVGAGPRRIVRELKPAHDWKFYGPQLATLTTMRLAGDDVGVWNSCCLLSGRISAELRAIAGVVDPAPSDVYGRQAPGGRPAESGVMYLPGAIAPDPAPAAAEAIAPSPTRPAAAAAPALELGGLADGYVINPVGTVDELRAKSIGRLRAWAVDWGVERCDLVWPMSVVVTDDRYWLLVRDRSAGPNGRRWVEIARLSTSVVPVVELVESLGPRHITAESAHKCMIMIAPDVPPGGTSTATQGE